MKKIALLAIGMLGSSLSLLAQPEQQGDGTQPKAGAPVERFTGKIINGAFERVHTNSKQPVPVHNIREADALYSWTVWRVIDLKQKQNLPLAHPTNPLTKIVVDVANSGDLDGYIFQSDDDAFKNAPMSLDEVKKAMSGQTDSQMVMDVNTGEEVMQVVSNPFNPEDIKRFRIKEEWVFDKQTSTMEVRILGIAPVGTLRSSTGDALGESALFWVYFPALRPTLARFDCFNWKNDAAGITYDDVFIKRLFASFVTKESNVRDERIQDYKQGDEALKESDRVKTKIVDFEQALWEY
jgi:gliding motility associated protien GldN